MTSSTELKWDGFVPLEQVLEHLQLAYGESWQSVADALQSDPIENAIIDTLINESQTTGLFQEPIRVDVHEPHALDECEDPEDHADYCVDVGKPTRYVLGNGTHRVVAAMTAGYPNIWVSSQDSSREVEGILIAEFDAEGGTGTCADCDDPVECFTFCVLRSFRLLPDTWAETGFASGINGTWRAVYELPEDNAAALENAVRNLAARHGITLKNLTITFEKDEDYE